ncbi:hypothetical protein [Clostridium pasteurianum]|uniref:Uncharacterized protein n=1 Tax=Clostridium pasteurianum BC1 TaxID=86416 RepID=R4K4P5_CLOPA|nr:hypothetical protein [Clostridium pasteurianum]AGK98132.1 hypothetical protein Clopa_3336 [Clostridium pasteurianum BC1]
MVKCPFLSAHNQEVECFEDCAFYNFQDAKGECPFKSITGKINNKVRRLDYNYYVNSEEDIFDFDEEYKKVGYL